MRRVILRLACAAALLLTSPLSATAAGINLSWNDCGSAGSDNKNFACGTDSGSAVLVGSVITATDLTAVTGLTAILDVWTSPDSAATTVPNWWQCGAGECRDGGIQTSFDFTTDSTCTDPWSGQATAGVNCQTQVPAPNHSRITVVGAVPSDQLTSLDHGVEYYAFKLNIGYLKTTGSGNCSGCSSAASIALVSVSVEQSSGITTTLAQPASRTLVTWQGGVAGSAYRTTPVSWPGFAIIRSSYR